MARNGPLEWTATYHGWHVTGIDVYVFAFFRLQMQLSILRAFALVI